MFISGLLLLTKTKTIQKMLLEIKHKINKQLILFELQSNIFYFVLVYVEYYYNSNKSK